VPFFSEQGYSRPERRFARSAIGDEHAREQLNYMTELYINSTNVYEEKFKTAVENYNFAKGRTWKAELKDQLNKRGIPPLEIPIILPRLLNVVGQYMESRGRIVAVPRQQVGVIPAEVGTQLLEAQNEWNAEITGNKRDQEVVKAFIDMLICDLGGWLRVYQDTDKNSLGLQVVKRMSPFYVRPDPKVDIEQSHTNGRFMIITYFETIDKIMAAWPEHREKIESIFGKYNRRNWFNALSDFWERLVGAREELRSEFINQKENTLRLIELQERRTETDLLLFNAYDGRMFGPMPREEAAVVLRDHEYLQQIEQSRETIWKSISIGDWLLLGEAPVDVQNGTFDVIPMPGLSFDGENFAPLVTPLKGVQTEYNQSRTSYLTFLRSSAFAGWMWERGSLDDDMVELMESNQGAAGFNVIYETGKPRPERITYQAISAGDVQRAQMALQDADNISTVGAGELGLPEAGGESGILHRQRIRQSIKSQRIIFENAANCEINVARYLLDMMQRYLQPGRVIEYAGRESRAQEIIVDENLRLDIYSIKLVQGDESETQRARKLAEIQSVLKLIPPERYLQILPLVMRQLNWHDVDEWVEKLGLNNQIPVEFQARLLRALSEEADSGAAPALPAGAEQEGLDQDLLALLGQGEMADAA